MSDDAKQAAAEHVLIEGQDDGAEFAVIVFEFGGRPAIRINVGGHVIVMPARKWHEAARSHPPEVTPICYVIAVEEYGQMVVYGPQYRVRESAEQDARLPKMRDQKAEVWACYRSQPQRERTPE